MSNHRPPKLFNTATGALNHYYGGHLILLSRIKETTSTGLAGAKKEIIKAV
jgi:hypothetical protein